ncbi:hypothetical protein DH2020_006481 [Rehmannia glutinosa]|uniref:Retrotransposon Copia-like N-terminal domain-containing protein n=1 Tax=Rehmannia glutinosa TaxID=99300 RepID=A0ABR0XIY8_REHGL
MENSTSYSILPTFNTISLRLDRSNYSYWKSQVLATVRVHGFDDYLLGTMPVPSKFLQSSSDALPTINPEYQVLMHRDAFLFSWLLSSMSESMLGHVNRCSTSADVWTVLEALFRSSSKARIMHLRLLLQTTKKSDLSIEEYVLKMRVVNLTNRSDTLSLQEVQFSLQSHEMRLAHLASMIAPSIAPIAHVAQRRFPSSEHGGHR